MCCLKLWDILVLWTKMARKQRLMLSSLNRKKQNTERGQWVPQGLARIWKMSDRRKAQRENKMSRVRVCLNSHRSVCARVCISWCYRILCFLQMEALKSAGSLEGTAICFQVSSFENIFLLPWIIDTQFSLPSTGGHATDLLKGGEKSKGELNCFPMCFRFTPWNWNKKESRAFRPPYRSRPTFVN